MNQDNTGVNLKRLQEILSAESKAIKEIPVTEAYAQAIETIIDRVHKRGGKLIVSGMGKAGQIAMNIATTFCSTGTPAVFLHPVEAQHGDFGVMRENDVMLVLSNSGKTREITDLISLSRDIYPEVPIIGITGVKESKLSEDSDIVLFTGGAPEVCPLQLTPTTSTTAMSVIGDLLIVSLMESIGFKVEDYAKRHPGGSLGQKSRKAVESLKEESADKSDQ